MRFTILAVILLGTLQVGCRYDPKKAPPHRQGSRTGDAFVIGDESSEVAGTVDVQEVDGVPKLVVNMHGE